MHKHAAHLQTRFPIRFEWGLSGATALAGGTDVTVVVDVLSFSTAVSVVCEAGAPVWPMPWNTGEQPDDLLEYAAQRNAVLAVGRSRGSADRPSLSPRHLRDFLAGRRTEQPRQDPSPGIVLPSPNGSRITHRLACSGTTVLAGSLRNAEAVAEWVRAARPESVLVVASGELWSEQELRPAVEDLYGAGAVLAALASGGRPIADFSPEAAAAIAGYTAVAGRLDDVLPQTASGLELVEGGFAEDVAIAAQVDVSRTVPVLTDGRFIGCAP